jgi:hypothetical protein
LLSSLPTRVIAAVLPLLVIALIAGAAGYFTKQTQIEPVPPLPEAEAGAEGLRGVVQGLSGDELVITTDAGRRLTLRLTSGANIEVLRAISAGELREGDWVNGGAIPHAQTVLALVGLVVIPDPVLETR